MARYFMHLRDHTDELLDPEGTEHPSLASLAAAVLRCARDVIKGDVDNGRIDFRYRIDAENEAGVIVHSLPFGAAVSVFPAV